MSIPPVKLSANSNARQMQLALADMAYLFQPPALDPWAGSHIEQSGIDAILHRLKREKLPGDRAMELTITVPPSQATPANARTLRDILAAHADARIDQQQDDLVLLNREIRQGLKVGGLFLASCLILAALVDQMAFLPDLLQFLLGESLIIAGWVGLWHPMELILYGWWPHRFRKDLLAYVKAAEIRLVPASPANGTIGTAPPASSC